MEKYQNISGKSGVLEYNSGEDFIEVKFRNNSIYLYDYSTTGQSNVEIMKKLAHNGSGLNSYICKCIKNNYLKRII